MPFRGLGEDFEFGAAVRPFTGNKRLRALGWIRTSVDPLWRIALPAPLPFTLLSVTQEMKVNGQ